MKLSTATFRFVRGLAIDFVISLAIGVFVGWAERQVNAQTQQRIREAWRWRIYPQLDPILRSEMQASFEGRQPPRLRRYIGVSWTLVMRELDEDAADVVVWFGKFAAGSPGFGEMYEAVEFDPDFWWRETNKRLEGERGRRERDPRADNLVRYPMRSWFLVHDPEVLALIRWLQSQQTSHERALQQIERSYRALDPSMRLGDHIAAIDSAIKRRGYATARNLARMTIERLVATYGLAANGIVAALSTLAAAQDSALTTLVGRSKSWQEDQKRLFDGLFGQQLLGRY